MELDNIPHYGRWHNQYGWLNLNRESQWGSVGIEGFHVTKATAKNPSSLRWVLSIATFP